MIHLIRCLALAIMLTAGTALADTAVDDLQLDALMLLVQLRTDGALNADKNTYMHLEALYARAETLRNRNHMDEAAALFRQVTAEGKLLATAMVPATSPAPATAEPDWTEAPAEEPETLPESPTSPYLVGGESFYTVERPESLRMVAAKLGVSVKQLVALNDVDPKKRLEPGQELRFNNLKIVPKKVANGLIINIPDRTLYYFRGGKLAKSIPVAVGKASKKKDEQTIPWQTPTGKFKVTAKAKDPVWRVPPSIQAEMAEQNKKVLEVVPPGKGNPLGQYAIRTSLSGIMLHSTNLPASIYGFNSHGCIRLMPKEMEGFFKEVRVNTPGEIIYKPVKLTVTAGGRVYLEVHPDIYEKVKDLEKESKRLIGASKVDQRVDWDKVRRVVRRKNGVAEDVTRELDEAKRAKKTTSNPDRRS